MTKDTSPPAFPNDATWYSGMTLRQYAAIKAMQGLLASDAAFGAYYQGSSHAIAEKAVEVADALIAELEKG